MTFELSLWFIILLVAGLASLYRLVRMTIAGAIDPFFGLLVGSVLTYIAIVPSLVQLSGQASEGSGSPARYAFVQALVLGLFLVPMWIVYRVRRRSNPLTPGALAHVRPRHNIQLVLVMGILHALTSLYVLQRRGFLYQRLGGSGNANATVGFGSIETALIGTFRDAAGLWMAIAALAFATRQRGKANPRHVASLSIALGALTLFPALINSRLDTIVLVAIAASFVLLTNTTPTQFGRRQLRLVIFGVLGAFVLTLAVLNIRANINATLRSSGSALTFDVVSPFGDGQGLGRIDCVDFLSRISAAELPAAGFEPFESVQWQLRRYVDRAGFDEFRLQGDTSPKTYFVRRVVSERLTDYASCAPVETFGSFSYLGLIAPGIVLALVFSALGSLLVRKARAHIGLAFYLVVGLLSWMLRFENGMSTILFGWLNVVPVAIGIAILQPFLASPSVAHTARSGRSPLVDSRRSLRP